MEGFFSGLLKTGSSAVKTRPEGTSQVQIQGRRVSGLGRRSIREGGVCKTFLQQCKNN
jgi:hypothetical protein